MSSRTSGRSRTSRSQLAYAGVAAAGDACIPDIPVRHVRLCETKIEHTHVAFGIDHDVIRLEIEMQDAAIVGVGHRVAQLAQYSHRRLGRSLSGSRRRVSAPSASPSISSMVTKCVPPS